MLLTTLFFIAASVFIASIVINNDMLFNASGIAIVVLIICIEVKAYNQDKELSAYCAKEGGTMKYVHAAKTNKCVLNGVDIWKAPQPIGK